VKVELLTAIKSESNQILKMAASMEYLEKIKELVEAVFLQNNIKYKKIAVIQRSNDFKFGEFCVPIGCICKENEKVTISAIHFRDILVMFFYHCTNKLLLTVFSSFM